MFPKFSPLWVIGLWGAIALSLPNRVIAATPLTRAEIQNLRNLVQLIPKNNPRKIPARKSDTLIPGDGLSTGRASLADLRFNDGSLARVGEQAVFKFLPKTRNLKLSNGTVLLLIPPGNGQTRLETPNAAAAIRGSALFVRYNQATDTTIVGALTNSDIGVANKTASQNYVLQAGQMMVIVKDKFQGLYDFDLKTFYETSDLVKELDLTKQNLTPNTDPALASVQAETAAALATQLPIIGQGVIDNPAFLQNTTSATNAPNQNPITENSPIEFLRNNLPVNSFIENGELLSNPQQESVNNNAGNNHNSSPNNQNSDPGHADGKPGDGNTNNQNSDPGNSDSKPGGGNTNNQNSGPGNSDGKPGGGNTNNQNSGPGNSDGKPGGGNTNNQNSGPGNSDGKPGGGNTNNQNSGRGNSDD